MSSELPAINAEPKTGNESFSSAGASIGMTVLDYWRWAHSDLVVNTERGLVAEYIVAQALGLTQGQVRREWDAYDLVTPDGIKVEVKSAAHIQSWAQRDYSPITFTVLPRRGWSDTAGFDANPKRHADVYVLAVLAHKDQATLNPLNLDQWSFYVVPTRLLNERERSQHSITLPSLAKAGIEPVGYVHLASAIRRAHSSGVGAQV